MGFGDRKEMLELLYIRYCMGILNEMPNLDDSDWKSIFDFCLKQSLVGIGFGGIERLKKVQQPPKSLKSIQPFSLPH